MSPTRQQILNVLREFERPHHEPFAEQVQRFADCAKVEFAEAVLGMAGRVDYSGLWYEKEPLGKYLVALRQMRGELESRADLDFRSKEILQIARSNIGAAEKIVSNQDRLVDEYGLGARDAGALAVQLRDDLKHQLTMMETAVSAHKNPDTARNKPRVVAIWVANLFVHLGREDQIKIGSKDTSDMSRAGAFRRHVDMAFGCFDIEANTDGPVEHAVNAYKSGKLA